MGTELPVSDRRFAIALTAICLPIVLVAGVCALDSYSRIQSHHVYSEAPGLVLVFSALSIAVALPNLVGSVFLLRGRAVGYRVISVCSLLSMLVSVFVFLYVVFAPLFLALAALAETRYRRLRR